MSHFADQYDEKTGNPVFDNAARARNKALRKALRGMRVSTPGGRRRKKHLQQVAGAVYANLIARVIDGLAAERALHAAGDHFVPSATN